MKLRLVPTLLLSLVAVTTPVVASAACACSAGKTALSTAKVGKLLPVGEKDAAWAAKARESYPLKTCVISEEALGSMGKSPEYIYRVDGQADRFVVFCCDGCEEDFLKDPAAALKKIDDAAKGAASAPKKTEGGHHGH